MKKRFNFYLLRTIILFLIAFLLAITSEIFITYWQNEKVMQPITKTTENIETISQLLNSIGRNISYLEEFRWDYNDTNELIDYLKQVNTDSKLYLSLMERDINKLKRSQYVLTASIDTSYVQFEKYENELIELLKNSQKDEAKYLYYDKIQVCGNFIKKYCQELLEVAILNNYESNEELLNLNENLNKNQRFILFLCVCFGVCMVVALVHLVIFVYKLAFSAKDISNGILDTPDIVYDRVDEMGSLISAFNEMKHSMKNQVLLLEEKNKIQKELLTKENESLGLKNLLEETKMQQLRSQINPHFLFNTINVIKYTAQSENAYKTDSLLKSLGEIYRCILESDTVQIPLSREIRIINEFKIFYSIRFRDRLSFYFDFSPDLDLTEILIPSFIIQPLVENAIKHGIGPKEEGGSVSIKVWSEEDILKISVNDNGVGMNDEKLKIILNNLSNPSSNGKHIGLYNVSQRLKLWNKESGINISSTEGKGTSICLWMPLVIQGVEYDE